MAGAMRSIILLLCMIAHNLFIVGQLSNKIKMYTFVTPSHQVFLDQYFLPSFSVLKNDFDLEIAEFEQADSAAYFMGPGWNTMMLNKVHLILRAIEETWGEIFVYADIDIQFFNSFASIIPALLAGKDLVTQHNHHLSCAGFFISRSNEKTKQLWLNVLTTMKSNPGLDDQRALVAHLSQKTIPDLEYGLLDLRFFSPGIITGKLWNPGDEFTIPKGIFLHHANWTVGIANKIEQLKYVQQLYGNQLRSL